MERFYLITSTAERLQELVPHGVKLVQLRAKDMSPEQLRTQVINAKASCQRYGAQFILNDYWELALALDVNFVHLGQEDMQKADLPALRRAGIRFGLSTHDEEELDKALSQNPDYIALGPIYPTQLKKMKWQPQGLERISQWKRSAKLTPLVAIGGLMPERLPAVFAAGADSAAVVTDIQLATDPIMRCKEWIVATQQEKRNESL